MRALLGADRRITRREMLVTTGAASGALALSGGVWQLARAAAPLASAAAPQFVSRPDLHIPGISIAGAGADVASGPILLAPYDAPNNAQAGAAVIDAATGAVIWEQPLSGLVTTDFRVQSYRGAPALTWWEGVIRLGHGVGSYVIADASYAPIARVDAGNGLHGDLHEFLLTERGTALLTSYVVTDADLRAVGGSSNGSIQDAIFQEIDIASGRVLLEWHSLEHIPITESYWPLGENWDYVHINSIAVDADDNLLVSSRNTHTIYKLDRSSGQIIWRLGGRSSDFALDRDAVFAWQHDARRQPDGSITVFDNGNSVSRALVLSVDDSARRVSLARAYTHPHALFADSQGNVEMLPNGNVFVGWGAQPYVSEFSPDGALLLDGRLGRDYISYRAYRAPWAGSGVGEPAVATRRGHGGSTVYVSWNGDTRVARWTALAGTSAANLVPIASAARRGFETSIGLPAAATVVRLRGTDASGRTLVTTAAASV